MVPSCCTNLLSLPVAIACCNKDEAIDLRKLDDRFRDDEHSSEGGGADAEDVVADSAAGPGLPIKLFAQLVAAQGDVAGGDVR